jgi:hypothetical protein
MTSAPMLDLPELRGLTRRKDVQPRPWGWSRPQTPAHGRGRPPHIPPLGASIRAPTVLDLAVSKKISGSAPGFLRRLYVCINVKRYTI